MRYFFPLPAQAGTQMDLAQQIDWAKQMTWLVPRLRGDERMWGPGLERSQTEAEGG